MGADTTYQGTGLQRRQDGTTAVPSGGSVDIESGASLKVAGTALTPTAAEYNVLHGMTASTAELNILDGVTKTAAQINALVGSTAGGKLIAGGEYTMVEGDDTAGVATIATGLTTVQSAIVQVVSAANVITEGGPPDAVVAFAGANITVGDGATYACTAGHKVRWIAFGV